MIHLVSGRPRGGKTLYAVRLIIAELVFGLRVIITNVPLKLADLAEYLAKNYPDRPIDVAHRIIILDDDRTKFFYLYRPGWTGRRLSKEEWQSGAVPDYSGIKDKGVFWVIDELHNFYGARQYAETGRDAMFYLSQHGHLGDTFVGVTQSVKNIDACFRRLAQDFTVVRNLSKERMGFFKLPGVFVRRTFFSEPGNGPQPAQETKTFSLDVSGIASCYSTAAGVGMHEAVDADKGERSKGLPWWIGVGVAVAAVFIVMSMAPAILGHLFNPKSAPSVVRASGGVVSVQTPQPVQEKTTPQKEETHSTMATITGYATFNGKTFITLSDGSMRVSDVKTGSTEYAPPTNKRVH